MRREEVAIFREILTAKGCERVLRLIVQDEGENDWASWFDHRAGISDALAEIFGLLCSSQLR